MELDELKQSINLSNMGWININDTNCYAYALGLDVPQNEICTCAYELGNIYYFYNNVKRCFRYHEELLLNDFKTLGLLYREASLDEEINDDEWKIAYFDSIYECGYHFFRQIENGIWWHKYDWKYAPTCLDDKGLIIEDPTHCNINYRGLVYQKSYILKR